MGPHIVQWLNINPAHTDKLIGAGCMLMWALSFSTIMTLVKTLAPELHNLTILFVRYLFGFVLFLPYILKHGPSAFSTQRPILHFARIGSLILSMLCSYYAYRHLPLVLATSIGMTGPLFTTILAMLLLGETVSWRKWALIILGYSGVLVMIRPHDVCWDLGILVALLANLAAGLTVISVKILSRTESTTVMMLYINTFTTLIAGLLAISVWTTPSVHDAFILLIIGVCGLISQYSLVTALKHANPSYLAPFEYTRMCFAIPVGYLFFAEVPSFWVMTGSAIIIGATYALTRLELKGAPQLQAKIP